jgi:3-oxoacyl-[acyl-carrier-protein] synthase-1
MAPSALAIHLAVSGIGMLSSLGLDAATSCASARAGLSRAAPLDAFQLYSDADWGNVGVTGHAAREYTRGFEGFGKLVRLGSGALADLLRTTPLQAVEWPRTALCVTVSSAYFETAAACLPEAGAEAAAALADLSQAVRNALLARVCTLNRVDCNPSLQFLFIDDQAGFCHALLKAQQLLADGLADRCIVGGIDALTEGATLAAAHQFHALKTEAQAAGFQPGEAAAFVLIESAAGAQAAGRPVLAQMVAAAVGLDPIGRAGTEPAVGIGLAGTMAECLRASPDHAPHVGWMLGDLNGDAFRANDWGYALVRLMPEHPSLGDCAMTLPAESFGELGAATGPVSVCMAVRGFARRYAPSSTAMAWLSSYSGSRGAFIIRSET